MTTDEKLKDLEHEAEACRRGIISDLVDCGNFTETEALCAGIEFTELIHKPETDWTAYHATIYRDGAAVMTASYSTGENIEFTLMLTGGSA